MNDSIKTIRIDKKTARFLLECIDYHRAANSRYKKEEAHEVCHAGIALITYLKEYADDGRSTWMTEGLETTLDRARHVFKKYSKLCDKRPGLEHWRARNAVPAKV